VAFGCLGGELVFDLLAVSHATKPTAKTETKPSNKTLIKPSRNTIPVLRT